MRHKLVVERDPSRFYTTVAPFLLRRRAENDLIIGIIRSMASSITGDEDGYWAYVTGGEEILGVVAMTRQGKPLLSYPCSEEACLLFARDMASQFYLIGIKGAEREVRWFSDEFSKITERPGKLLNVLLCYQLTTPMDTICEETSLALEEDIPLVTLWTKEFFRETLPYDSPSDILLERTKESIEAKQIFLLRNPSPASMLKVIPTTPTSCRITYVYTPPEKRGRGYASRLVSDMSRRLLTSGNSFIILYTIASDPITNRLYPKLGYRVVNELHEFCFASY